MIEDIIDQSKQELKRGLTVLSVLGALREAEYGYSLSQKLALMGLPIETNTLYPLLRRLEKQDLLKSFWDTDTSKPRKYYQVTENGILVFNRLSESWKAYNAVIKEINKGGLAHE
ncbi:MAG: PadR family transcriptional regulator [Candidatus Izemoplasmataceae bacterium]